MPPADYALTNYRIDTRGHILAVEFRDWGSDEIGFYTDWRWYNLDGDIIESGRVYTTGETEPEVWDLRVDARGHVVAVSYGVARPHWYDLDATDLGEAEATNGVPDIRLDTRGHVVAVLMGDANWYDLNGDVAA